MEQRYIKIGNRIRSESKSEFRFHSSDTDYPMVNFAEDNN